MGQLERLTFEQLAELDDGRIGLALESHLASTLHECRNRPVNAQGKPLKREITITLMITPEPRIDEFNRPTFDRVSTEVKIKSKTPDIVSAPIAMKVGGDGFYFNPDSPEDLGVQKLPFGDDDE